MTALLVAAVLAVAPHSATQPPGGCSKTFSGPMIKRAIDAVYAGTRDVSRHDRQHLSRYMRCARPHVNRARIHRRLRSAKAAWQARLHPIQGYWYASWYSDGGQTASGWHATYGVAMCGAAGPCYAFGTRIEIYYGGRHVTAVVDDHGPYAGGRNIDLNQNVAAAIGFGGIGTVGYHVY